MLKYMYIHVESYVIFFSLFISFPYLVTKLRHKTHRYLLNILVYSFKYIIIFSLANTCNVSLKYYFDNINDKTFILRKSFLHLNVQN